ncbi:MAG: cell division protein SepF [Streptosporangiales bacterium]
MPGLMRRTMSYLGLVEDYDDEYEYEDDVPRERDRARRERVDTAHVVDDDEWDPVPARPATRPRPTPADEPREAREVREPREAPRAVESRSADLSRISTVHPRSYSDARTIGEQFRDGTPVIMNLSEMDDADAKRLVDFSAGLIFGRRGSIDRVTSRVFLLSPPDIEVTAEDKARIVEGNLPLPHERAGHG